MNIELFKGSDGWRWRLVADNGEILATSEAYTRKTDARRTAKLVYNAFLKGDPDVGYEEVAPMPLEGEYTGLAAERLLNE